MTQDRLPSLTETTWLWLKIGCLSFGGPAGQIAMMHRAVVEERQWLSDARFLHALNYCTLLPGPEAQQLATYIGWLMHGVRGGLIAGVLFVLPGALVMLALSILYLLYAEVPAIQAVFYGLKAAVLAIVIEAVVRIGKRTLGQNWLIAIAGAAFTALFLFNAPFPWVVLGAGLLGLAAGLAGVSPNSGGKEGEGLQSGLVDRLITAGALPHTVRNAGRTLLATLACLGAWAAPIALVFAITADGSVWRNLAVFFSQAAIVTFGGAYAVLPYVAQQAVETYQWMEPKEMLHGLALAETTPGPLILVLQFVGFLAAAKEAGGLHPILAGILGGLLTTWVTFAPSFLWIFAGAPYAEAIRTITALRTALLAITAAVLGVIMNLAVWFGLHVIFTRIETVQSGPARLYVPDVASFDPVALGITAAAAVLLIRIKLGVIPVLLLCAALGAAWQLRAMWL